MFSTKVVHVFRKTRTRFYRIIRQKTRTNIEIDNNPPYYDENLRSHTGNEKAVQDFVRRGGTADVFLDKLYDMIDFLFPYYVKEGKNQLVIAVGCTGGKHRSVTVANRLYERLKEHSEIGLKLEHRDIEMDNRTKG